MSDSNYTFRPRVKYGQDGWFGLVYRGDARDPYWRGSRFTRWGALFAARRQAEKLNRLAAKGYVR